MNSLECKILYLAWQDPESRVWHPVGRLTYENGIYKFVYTKGALASNNFIPFGRMRNLFFEYKSNELFPLFANRLLSKSRPEYSDFISWLNLSEEQVDPFVVFSRTGGHRETDNLVVYPCPRRGKDNTYTVYFFSHGLRYMSKDALNIVNSLKQGSRLYLKPDPGNQYDKFAIEIRTQNPPLVVGYCPRFYSEDFNIILKSEAASSVRVVVEKINLDAPIQMRLLCKLSCEWPKDFNPCSGDDYISIAQGDYSPISVGALEATL